MNAQQVWQAQEIDAPRISLAYVRHMASDFDRRRRLRAAAGYVVALAGCGLHVMLSWQVHSVKPLMAAGSVALVLGMLFVMYRLHRHVSAESSPADAGVLDTLRYQRRQLERQRDWRLGSWRLVLPALLPGFSLILAALYFEIQPVPWRQMALVVFMLTAAIVTEAVVGKRKAQRSQREIDALDSLAKDP